MSEPNGSGSQSNGPIRVLLVDDHQIVLDGLSSMLRPFSDAVEVVGKTTDPKEVVALMRHTCPDVALVDVRMRTSNGFELCEELLESSPKVKVVLLTVYDDEQYLFQGLKAGASGFLTKQIDAPQLIAHLRLVMAGETVVDPLLAGRVALSAAHLQRGEFWAGAHMGLSQRESEVLQLMVHGVSNKAIAKRLVLGEETVKTHVSSIYRKLSVSDRTQAVAFALREGIFL
jgi:DNA-binding NarL/FixJ family response regulator